MNALPTHARTCTCGSLSRTALGFIHLGSVTCRPPTRRAVAAKANEGDKRVDWDREWNSFVNDRQQQGPGSSRQSNVYTTTGNSSQHRRAVPVDPAARMTRDAIKREESILLNAWSSDKFQGAGVALAVLVLLVLLLAAGPPPTDTRCTLPWC